MDPDLRGLEKAEETDSVRRVIAADISEVLDKTVVVVAGNDSMTGVELGVLMIKVLNRLGGARPSSHLVVPSTTEK